MSKKDPRRGELTPEDRAAAARLRQLWDEKRRELGITQEAAGAAIGCNQSAVSQYLNAKIPLGVAATIRWATLLGVDPADIRPGIAALLHRGQTRQLTPSLGGIEGMSAWDSTTPLDEDEVEVPLFKEVEVSAGPGLTAHAVEQSSRRLRFSRATLRAAGVDESNAACATVTGNSMEPTIVDGSTIGIDRGRTQLVDGELYAIDHDGMLRVKYLYRMPGGGIRLRSENATEHPDETYTAEETKKIRVLGWVFWWSTVRKWRGR